MADNRAIGIFDSGLGGLTVTREIIKLLPCENVVYFGDTGRVPYGTKGRDTIRKYALQDERFLLSHNVKLIVAACGTVSSVAIARAVCRGGFALRKSGSCRHKKQKNRCACYKHNNKQRRSQKSDT